MNIITVSLSSPANHVTAQLFNAQESHLPYTKSAPRFHDYLAFLSTTKNKNGTTNYAPRALVYDLNGGFGGAPKYEVDPSTISNVEVINTAPRVPKHAFQSKLDLGIDNAQLLSVSNTKYWTDYNKLIYKPLSCVLLQDWDSGTPYGTNRNFPRSMASQKTTEEWISTRNVAVLLRLLSSPTICHCSSQYAPHVKAKFWRLVSTLQANGTRVL